MLGRGQRAMEAGFRRILARLPFPVCELHSDNGQIGFRARSRVDGRVVLSDAARALAHSAT